MRGLVIYFMTGIKHHNAPRGRKIHDDDVCFDYSFY